MCAGWKDTVAEEGEPWALRLSLNDKFCFGTSVARERADIRILLFLLWYGVLFAPFSLTYSTSCFWVLPLYLKEEPLVKRIALDLGWG